MEQRETFATETGWIVARRADEPATSPIDGIEGMGGTSTNRAASRSTRSENLIDKVRGEQRGSVTAPASVSSDQRKRRRRDAVPDPTRTVATAAEDTTVHARLHAATAAVLLGDHDARDDIAHDGDGSASDEGEGDRSVQCPPCPPWTVCPVRSPMRSPSVRLAAFADDYHRVREWFDWRLGPEGGLRGVVRRGDGLAVIPGFLPPRVAEDALAELKRVPNPTWIDTAAARDYGENNIEHRFKSCQPDRLEALMRIFEVPLPGTLTAFNAARCVGPACHPLSIPTDYPTHHSLPHDPLWQLS